MGVRAARSLRLAPIALFERCKGERVASPGERDSRRYSSHVPPRGARARVPSAPWRGLSSGRHIAAGPAGRSDRPRRRGRGRGVAVGLGGVGAVLRAPKPLPSFLMFSITVRYVHLPRAPGARCGHGPVAVPQSPHPSRHAVRHAAPPGTAGTLAGTRGRWGTHHTAWSVPAATRTRRARRCRCTARLGRGTRSAGAGRVPCVTVRARVHRVAQVTVPGVRMAPA